MVSGTWGRLKTNHFIVIYGSNEHQRVAKSVRFIWCGDSLSAHFRPVEQLRHGSACVSAMSDKCVLYSLSY